MAGNYFLALVPLRETIQTITDEFQDRLRRATPGPSEELMTELLENCETVREENLHLTLKFLGKKKPIEAPPDFDRYATIFMEAGVYQNRNPVLYLHAGWDQKISTVYGSTPHMTLAKGGSVETMREVMTQVNSYYRSEFTSRFVMMLLKTVGGGMPYEIVEDYG